MKIIPVISLWLISTAAYSQSESPLKLWYTSPAGEVWENALPIGNGRMGAMVYGNPDIETIQLNEHSLWSGSPHRNDNPLCLDSLSFIRKLINQGKQKEAEELANRTIISKSSHGQMFLPAGELKIKFPGHRNYTDYFRELNISNAVAKTSYTFEGKTFTREAFASFTDRVVVAHFTCSQAAAISFTTFFKPSLPNTTVTIDSKKRIIISGISPGHEKIPGKIKYYGIIELKTIGGSVENSDTSLSIHNASAVTIYISIATNFTDYHTLNANESEIAGSFLKRAIRKPYQQLQKEHVQYYQRYFNRVTLKLGAGGFDHLPTDERLRGFTKVNDPSFAALYYQFGRYLLISASQPGGQPANLQGIWNNKVRPPWDSKYTININAQMNYWPAEKTNLSELHEPFLTMVKEMARTGTATAGNMYGARGWMAHHNTDIWRATGAVDAAFWGAWVNGGGWSSQHLWEHYQYTGDTKFLKSVYPVLKGAALFYVDFLTPHPRENWLVINPDMSPENAPAAHQGSSLDAGVTMSNQIVFDVFSNTAQAASVLGIDRSFADTLLALRSKLPPMHIGQHGQLQEWLEDIDDPNDHHRHISHLYGLFPSNQISPYRTPALYNASKTTLLQRGDISTGWSMGWKVNWWAKLLDGNHAYRLIQNQLTPVGTVEGGGGTYNNLFDAHPPFQIDGNFGCTSGITEMLIQSSDNAVHLLPALPDAWSMMGSISGIKTRGGFEVIKLSWKEGKITEAVIKSSLGGNLRIRSYQALKGIQGIVKKATGVNNNPFFRMDPVPPPVISGKATIAEPSLKKVYEYDINTKAGQIVKLIQE